MEGIVYDFHEGRTYDEIGICIFMYSTINVPNGLVFQTKRFDNIIVDNTRKQLCIDADNTNLLKLKELDLYFSSNDFKNAFLSQLDNPGGEDFKISICDGEDFISAKVLLECINLYTYESIFQNDKCCIDLSDYDSYSDKDKAEMNISTKLIKKSKHGSEKILFNSFHVTQRIDKFKFSDARFIYSLTGIWFDHSKKIYKLCTEIHTIEYLDNAESEEIK
jgi:hypothetical protein